jgi:hypothetical protein
VSRLQSAGKVAHGHPQRLSQPLQGRDRGRRLIVLGLGDEAPESVRCSRTNVTLYWTVHPVRDDIARPCPHPWARWDRHLSRIVPRWWWTDPWRSPASARPPPESVSAAVCAADDRGPRLHQSRERIRECVLTDSHSRSAATEFTRSVWRRAPDDGSVRAKQDTSRRNSAKSSCRAIPRRSPTNADR